MLARLAIRFGTALAGIAVGLLVAAAALSGFSLDVTALVEATLIFWIIHLGVQIFALRVLVREPSIALAGLLAVASTVVSLILVNLIVSGLNIRGFQAYVGAALIVWLTTAVSDMIGRRMLRARRER